MTQGGLDAVVLADGKYGAFAGSATDAVVFGTYRRTGTWSPELVKLLTLRLFAGGRGTFLDVGANIGLVTVPVLEHTSVCAHAFEPAPQNFALLEQNLARHGLLARARLYPCALSDARGGAELALSEDNSGDHRLLLRPDASERGRVAVRTEALDGLLGEQELEHPVVMKLDCQGAEVRVLRGATRVLEQVDFVVVEYWPAGLRRMGDRVAELQSLLSAFPFGVYLPAQRPPDPLQPADALFASLSWVATDGSDEGFFDLLLVRSQP